jgi:hypothetical protein
LTSFSLSKKLLIKAVYLLLESTVNLWLKRLF